MPGWDDLECFLVLGKSSLTEDVKAFKEGHSSDFIDFLLGERIYWSLFNRLWALLREEGAQFFTFGRYFETSSYFYFWWSSLSWCLASRLGWCNWRSQEIIKHVAIVLLTISRRFPLRESINNWWLSILGHYQVFQSIWISSRRITSVANDVPLTVAAHSPSYRHFNVFRLRFFRFY